MVYRVTGVLNLTLNCHYSIFTYSLNERVGQMTHVQQLDLLLQKLHIPMYRACIREGATEKAEEVRRHVLKIYGIDLRFVVGIPSAILS